MIKKTTLSSWVQPLVAKWKSLYAGSSRKLIAVVAAGVLIFLLICGTIVEAYERTKVGKCVAQQLGKVVHAKTDVHFGGIPLIISYLNNNLSEVSFRADNAYEHSNLHVVGKASDTNLSSGISKKVTIAARWQVSDMEKYLRSNLTGLPVISSDNIVLTSSKNDLLLELKSPPLLDIQLKLRPVAQGNTLRFEVEQTSLGGPFNIKGLPNPLVQQVVDAVTQSLGDNLAPSLPGGLAYREVHVDNNELTVEISGEDYPRSGTVNIAKICGP